MAGSLGDYGEIAALDALFGSGSPATYYVALYTAAPTDSGGGTEVAAGDYARKGVTNDGTLFPGASSGSTTTGADITFAQAVASWGDIAAFGLFDAATDGNLYAWCDADVTKTCGAGDTYQIAAGDLTITMD